MISQLKNIGYNVDVQILNFNGKVIGVIASSQSDGITGLFLVIHL